MTRWSNISFRFHRFCADGCGNVAIIFALTMPILFGLVGAAIDYGRATDSRTAVSTALDAAVLAAAKKLSMEDASNRDVITFAEGMFLANLNGNNPDLAGRPEFSFTIDRAGNAVRATVDAAVQPVMMQLLGFDTIDIGVTSAARFSDKTLELALVLDVTGSMTGEKIEALESAASAFVAQLLPQSGADARIRIGIVPYAAGVNAGRYANRVADRGGRGTCMTERRGSESNSDADPFSHPISRDRRAVGRCPNAEIQPLTSDRRALQNVINDFEAEGYTAGHLGAAWAYYMLSPDWRRVWPTRSDPDNFKTGDTIKIVVLMTDGKFNTYFDGVSDPWGNQRTRSEASARAVCSNMKSDEIIVFSVAFNAPSEAQRLLEDCATTNTDEHVFVPETSEELIKDFVAIANAITELRVTE